MTDYTTTIVTITDLRKAGYCVSGIRSWFEDRGFNFRDFIEHGMPADQLIAKNDELINRAIRIKVGLE